MNSENMLFMIYFMPQINCLTSFQINPQWCDQMSKVEQQQVQNKRQEIIFYNPTNQDFKQKKIKVTENHQANQRQDSSFFVPTKQENKTSQQKLGRNSVSNILRLFTKMLKSPMIRKKFEKAREKFNFQVTFKQFNSWVLGIGLNTTKYIRFKKVMNGIKSKPEFGRIFAILYHVFAQEYSRASILTSSKTQSKNILPTLFHVRNILEQISEAICQRLSKSKQNILLQG